MSIVFVGRMRGGEEEDGRGRESLTARGLANSVVSGQVGRPINAVHITKVARVFLLFFR